MPRRRSRSNTEARFKEAVLELVAESGCARLGINPIAQRAGSDKVLIYRYFANLEGLLQSVAELPNALPSPEDTLQAAAFANTPAGMLNALARHVARSVSADAATEQRMRWRHAVRNPLTEAISAEWSALWRSLAAAMSADLDHHERSSWQSAFALTALAAEAEICGEPVDSDDFERIAIGLSSAPVPEIDGTETNDTLPVNLL